MRRAGGCVLPCGAGRSGDRLINRLAHVRDVALARELPGVLAHSLIIERQPHHTVERGGQRVGMQLVEEYARFSVHHRLERAATRQRNDRPAARLRLERSDSEILLPGQDERQRAPVLVADRVVRQRTEESHVLSGERSEEHTSELQSLAYLVCRLLLEKKKTHSSTAAPSP